MKIIAVDAGGTKARFALYEDHQVLASFESASLHPLQVGMKAMAAALREGVDALCSYAHSEAEYISFGLAGYGQNTKIRKQIERAIQKQFPTEHYCIHSDVECALMAALQGKDGIMVIAGTGSIALAQVQGARLRTGGWGYLIGDEGSAYDLGRKTLSLFSKMADGRMKKTALYDVMMDALVLNEPSDLVSILHQHKNPKEATAALARILSKAAKQNDVHAQRLFKEAAYELSLLVKAINQLAPNLSCVRVTGGVFESGGLILDPFKTALGSDYDVDVSAHAPIYGSYLIGLEKSQK